MLAADRPSSLPSRISYGSFSSPYGSGSWRAREIKRISRFKSFGFSTTEGEKRARRDQLLIQEGGHSPRDRYDLTVYTPVLQESWLLWNGKLRESWGASVTIWRTRTIGQPSPSILVREENRCANISQSRTFDRSLSFIDYLPWLPLLLYRIRLLLNPSRKNKRIFCCYLPKKKSFDSLSRWMITRANLDNPWKR